MARPKKPYEVLKSENRSHRTKAELEARKQGEAAFATGEKMKPRPETKKNMPAYTEFKRISKLFETIGKNDAIYEAIINRYCAIYAECLDFENQKNIFTKDLIDLQNDKERIIDTQIASLTWYYNQKSKIQQNIIALDRQLQSKRKMLLDIEKECTMTVSSALRNIPKKEEDTKNPLLEILNGG